MSIRQRTMMIGLLTVAVCFLVQVQRARANNITVPQGALWNQNVGASIVYVEFDLSWDNSWRTDVNRDAAWVFVKFRPEDSNDWQHATLSTNDSNHQAASGSTIDTSSDGKGVFIYRLGNGTGDVNYVRTRLRWDYGLDGYGFQKGDKVEISVHAIEMVYIPQGAFYLGSGGIEYGHFYQYTDGTQSTNPYLVSSEAAITTSTNTSGDLWGTGGTNGTDAVAPSNGSVISNAFPKGYSAFYCMKYEISQGQYADFLNMLNDTQDGTRYPNYSASRYTITGNYTNYSAGAPDRACNYLSWADGAAYADWAALRPMTELEFEKACRGTEAPVLNEYAWGNMTISAPTSIIGDDSPTSTVNQGNCNYSSASPDGPFRCGIFAASVTNPTRTQAGASYYGVMEMSGNSRERPVSVGNSAGRTFMGTHGDGELDGSGNATNGDWPGTGADGAGSRGGSWFLVADIARVSDRYYAVETYSSRNSNYGWRCARSAP